MLTIRAVSFKGRPLDRELAARFEEAGGTIGRGETNTLVLADPERFISRTHATISFQAGGFLITDTGTKNPVVVNGLNTVTNPISGTQQFFRLSQ